MKVNGMYFGQNGEAKANGKPANGKANGKANGNGNGQVPPPIETDIPWMRQEMIPGVENRILLIGVGLMAAITLLRR